MFDTAVYAIQLYHLNIENILSSSLVIVMMYNINKLYI